MTVDVTWDGVSLAKGVQARDQDGGWFVELEQPMPVGTVLQLEGEVSATVSVARVHEGAGAGMLVKKADSRASAADSPKPEPEEKEPGKESEKESEKESKRDRRKKRKG
jgi:hypothetical protein